MHIEWVESVLERFQRDQLGKLSTEHLGMSTQMMRHDLRSLLVLGKITTLEEPTRPRRVHEEVGWPAQFNDKTTGSGRRTIGIGDRVTRFQLNAFDESKGKLDLVAGRVVVDVVCDACFVGGIEDDQVHSVLSDSAPRTNTQGPTCKVVDD